MYYDTDGPGAVVQGKRGIMHVARDPVDPLYARQWDFKLPPNHAQPLDAPGRRPRTAISCVRMTPWSAPYRTKKRAGAGGTTTI